LKYLLIYLGVLTLFLWGWSRFKRYEKNKWNEEYMQQQEYYKDEGEIPPNIRG